jgi:hypothetical protein
MEIAIKAIPRGSHINLYPEKDDVYEGLMESKYIIEHNWDANRHCSNQQWNQRIRTMISSQRTITVGPIDRNDGCPYRR